MRLKKLRAARGLSQEVLARKARITREYVHKLEGDRYDPTISGVQRLAKALKVKLTELVE
jgi:transcriptional regulator with XRE-family HTH domain